MHGVTTRTIVATAIVLTNLLLAACGGSGGTRPTPIPQDAASHDASKSTLASTVETPQTCRAGATRFIPTVVLPARDQGTQCNSCWAFATAGAFEQSHLHKSGIAIDVSESQILDCSNKGNCGQGTWAFDYLTSTGAAREAEYQPATQDQKICLTQAASLRALTWSAVNPNALPTPAEIKAAVRAHGAVVSRIAETAAFQNYSGGVFTETGNEPLHHAVVIIGWDDCLGAAGAWRVRNSRGSGWGENGYMWIDYGSNGIGATAAWVDADAAPRPPSPPCPPPVLSSGSGPPTTTNCSP